MKSNNDPKRSLLPQLTIRIPVHTRIHSIRLPSIHRHANTTPWHLPGVSRYLRAAHTPAEFPS
jgi:hypothetical protein